MATERYFYISAVGRCKRPRFFIEVAVDLKSDLCVVARINQLPWQQDDSFYLGHFKTKKAQI